ncbi:MAG: TrkH family potassium uptake protein [Paludibacteraceae bacterium]|nr:TrkH family potassium uptake protein [Paludibacteraceae bacterium]
MKILNIRMILRVMSMLLLIEAFFILLSGGISWLMGDGDWIWFLFSAGITVIFSALGMLVTRSARRDLGKREGYLIVSTVWLFFSLFGGLPYYLSGAIPSVTDVFFETMSGFTTTGSTILNDIESLSHGMLLWRSITQWIGGMGIIVLSLSILPMLGVEGMQLFLAEVPGPTKDKLHAKVSYTGRVLWGIYTVLTLIESLCLWVGGMDYFDAICHALTTMASGGFSTKNASIAAFESPVIEYIIMVFMFLSGINFALYFRLLTGQFGKFFRDEEFRHYCRILMILILLVGIGLYFTQREAMTIPEVIRNSMFNVIALVTTTGYATVEYMEWSPFVWTSIMIAMLFSACAGSTSGGIKTARLVLLFKNSVYEFKRLIHPNAVLPVQFNGHVISPQIVNSIVAFIALYVSIIVISILVFTFNGMSFDLAFGTAVSAIGNIGPTVGGIGATTSYAGLTDFAKCYMAVLMLIGRLEIFTVLIIFTPAFWKK